MPKCKFRVLSDRPNSYTGKKGFVQERVLTFVDDEQDPAAVLCATVQFKLRKGDEMDVKFPKLQGQVVEFGLIEMDKFQGVLQCRGNILSVVAVPAGSTTAK